MPHRIAKFLEQRLYSRADGIVALSHRAKKAIDSLPQVQRKATPVIVVPSCVDLNHFRFSEAKPERERDLLRFVYNGSVGGRYILDRIGRFVVAASRETRRVHLRVLSRAEPELVASMLNTGNLSGDLWSLHSVPYSAVPGELTDHQAGLSFLTQGISEHGCSPTKIGEYWAVGMPVITTPNVSDTDDIIRRERVGVIVQEHSDDAYLSAIKELQRLLKDPELASRCRRAAETHYALEPACERQLALYRDIVQAKERLRQIA
jgi:glycosyltransferase involved in cell wall biosynthesis